MRYALLLTTVFVGLAGADLVRAGIPEPDAVLYGTLTLDGRSVSASEDVTVIARVNGVSDAVGTCRMGERPDAGDQYVLRIRVESLADGSTQSSNAALIGQTARIFIKPGRGVEKHAMDFVISERGITRQQDLVASTGDDCNGNTVADTLDITSGHSKDCNSNGIPDECESDSALTGPDCPRHSGGGGGGGATTYALTASVVGLHGSIKMEPPGGSYAAGTIVTLVATPAPGFRVKAWRGTNNDASTEQTNAVTVDADRTVTVEFEALVLTALATADATSIVAGQSTTLHAGASGGVPPYTFAWTPGEGLSSVSVIDPVATPASTTTYTLTVTDAMAGTATASVIILVGTTPVEPTAPPSGNETPDAEQPEPPAARDTPVFPICGTGMVEAIMLSAIGLTLMGTRRRR